MIGIVLAFFNVVASSQILPLLPKAAAKVIQIVNIQCILHIFSLDLYQMQVLRYEVVEIVV